MPVARSVRSAPFVVAALLLAAAAAPARAATLGVVGYDHPMPRVDPRPAARAVDRTVGRQDPADSLYRAARELMGRGDYRRAAELFGRVGRDFPKSAYVYEAAYYEAFARYRTGTTDELRRARTLLAPLRTGDVAAGRALRRDAAALDTRVCGELARRGDEQCAQLVAARADSSSLGTVVAEAVETGMRAAREAMHDPEVRAAIAGAGQTAALAAREATRAAAEALSDPEVQRSIREAGAEAGAAAAEGVRGAAEAVREATAELRVEAIAEARAGRRSTRDPRCRDADDDERVVALNALQQMDPERATPLLEKVLARRDACSETLRRKAVFLVARTRTPRAADMLLTAARTDPDAEVREQAVFWLARVPGERSLTLLREVATRDTSIALRKRAVFALSQQGSAPARAMLRELAESRQTPTEVRGEAIYWLGRRSEQAEDVEWLRRLWPTLESRELKERALSALARQKGSTPWLLGVARDAREPIEVRKAALSAASRTATVAELGALWDATKDREMKEALVYAFTQRKEPEAVDRLITVARTESDRELRKSAVFWLSRSNDPRALAFLQELIER